jgi:hypothetical protein
MNDRATTDALPTPEQMRNYFAASRSAWQARRLQEASRAIITGNIAGAVCFGPTVLVVLHAGWLTRDDGTSDEIRMFALCGVLWGFIACMFVSLLWLRRQRLRSPVYVLNRLETEARQLPPRPFATTVILIGYVIGIFLMSSLWSVAFQYMSSSAILAILSVGPLIAVGYFVYRFVSFLFWEDLVFAAAVALAWMPIPFMAWHLVPVCLAAFPMVIGATLSLHLRWARWQRSVALHNAEAPGQEVDS